MTQAHEIDFKIYGQDMQMVEIELDPQETVVAEAGALMYMGNGIQMETKFGDGSNEEKGFIGKLGAGLKRKITGETLFMTHFTNQGQGKQQVSFAAPYPGKIIPIDLAKHNGTIICQKDAFLCTAKGNSLGIAFQKKLGAGFFGGEGFIMQKIQGNGLAFLHAGGAIVAKELQPGEILKLDTGCLVALENSVDYDVQFIGGIKNAFLGGEGLFLATLKGPGKVYMQSLPFNKMAERILSAGTHQSSNNGSSRGGLGGAVLGSLLDD